MTWENFAALAVAWVTQWFKGTTTDNRIVVLVGGLVGVGLYAIKVHPAPPYDQWIMTAIMWAAAVIGGASALGHAGIAPATKPNA